MYACKDCIQKNNQKWRNKNVDRCKKRASEYAKTHRKEQNARAKKFYYKHKEKLLAKMKIFRENNPQIKKMWDQKWKQKNANYKKNRRDTDIQFKLATNLRSRLCHALKLTKGGSSIKDLGCSISELKQHLESKFQPNMTWENYGRNGWHIDHIKPLSSFDLTNRKQFLEACHYTNLQPLWAKDNIRKHNHI